MISIYDDRSAMARDAKMFKTSKYFPPKYCFSLVFFYIEVFIIGLDLAFFDVLD